MTSDTDQRPVDRPGSGSGSGSSGSRRRGRVRLFAGAFRLVAVGVVAVLVAGLVLTGIGSVLNWHWPFSSREIDRSGPAVLTAVQNLSEYHAASGSYQIVIDIQDDTKWVPDILKGKRTIFLAIGSVDSYIDFRTLGPKAVQVSSDRRSVILQLPHAQLSRPTVDPRQSRVLDRNLGLVDRLGGIFSSNPNPQDQRMWILAEEKLSDAAKQVKLTDRAESNTRTTLTRLLQALGFTSVTITFTTSPT